MRTVAVVAAMAALAWVAPARADGPQSLGEVAAQQKEKKKGKVYTEDDLHGPRGTGTVSQPASSGTGAAPAASPSPGDKKDGDKAAASAPKAKTDDELRAEAETAWREKVTQAQNDVTRWTAEVDRLQASLNDNTVPLYGTGRATRQTALDGAKNQLATARTTLENLQEEGRRNRYR